VLAKAGVKLDRLLARADDDSREGVGGPLMAEEDVDLASLDGGDAVQGAARTQALRRIAASLPLTEPMDGYRVMSQYGRRADPITRRRAVHEGIDLSGARDQRIRATQSGVVTHAGRNGDYGITVEIDHGMGITTRFAHMKSVLVRKGQRVTVGREIGVIGSTGRSTGRHLHYEIRLDGRSINPAPFLEATRVYGNILKG
jgi:murein DD-endopeptidase MepM/ murein hydrolase activator NlpD